MLLLNIFLISIIIILLIFIFRYKKNIEYISDQIKKSKGDYTSIRTKILDKDAENLVVAINYLYEENEKKYLQVKTRDEELRMSISNIAHDLRTPLTSIMGYIQLIEDDKLTEEDRKKYINIVKRRTETLQSLITSFYELARVEASEYKFDLKAINLSNLLCETIALYYDEFVKNNIEPEIKVNENTSLVIADEKAVMRIFSNLINNIIKHGDRNVIIELREDGEFLVTEFKNYAPKLTKENASHIFDRFFTADTARSDKNTGLGLSITKSFVEQLGHEIEANLANGILNIKIIWKKI